ncbi:glycerophosphodiester phosphodiesterase 1 [Scomber scombrus]|uniref:Glycerophosphodiester phosphodiesterase 1 n=1 Tax=Scomber scombrus TaxID=13677 RepID=A0AAV1PVC5_SCOSC
MLQLGDEATLYSLVFVVVLLGTRSPVWTTVLTASLYLFLAMFRFPQANKNGATGVELDLEFSADGVPILLHDDTVDRTTNGSGPLSQIRFSDLGKLDAAAKHRLREKFAGEKIPTLEEAVEECIRLQLTIYFDVKGHPDEAAAALTALYKKHPVLYNSSIVCSFEPKVIYRVRGHPEVSQGVQ